MPFISSSVSATGRAINALLFRVGYEIRPLVDDSDGIIVTPKIQHRQDREIATAFQTATVGTALAHAVTLPLVLEAIHEFRRLFERTPVKQTYGGSGFNSCLNLYLVGRLLRPDVVIESGTYKGLTSWVLRHACPHARIHCFDLSFAPLIYRDKSIHYHECDVNDTTLSLDPSDRVLAFFDDHVSHARRLRDASRFHAQYIVFDDDFGVERLYIDKCPALPTLSVICDRDLADGETIDWRAYRRRHSYRHVAADAEEARRHIKHYRRLPDLANTTGYRPSWMSYVETKVGQT